MKKLIIFCIISAFSLFFLVNRIDAYTIEDVYVWEETNFYFEFDSGEADYRTSLFYKIEANTYYMFELFDETDNSIEFGTDTCDYLKDEITLVSTSSDEILSDDNMKFVSKNINNCLFTVNDDGFNLSFLFRYNYYNEEKLYIKAYTLNMYAYSEDVNDNSLLFSDLYNLDINYSDYYETETTSIIAITLSSEADKLYLYLYDSFDYIYQYNAQIKIFDILTGETEYINLTKKEKAGNFFKFTVYQTLLNKFDNSLIIEFEVQGLVSDSNILEEENNKYYMQHIILEKSSNSSKYELSYYSIDTLKIDVEATYGYKYIENCSYALGFIPYTDERILLHYLTFDAYKNGEKFDLDKMITQVQLKYQWDTYESGYLQIGVFDHDESDIFDNKTYVSKKAIITETITPIDVSINYGASVDSFSDYWTYLFNDNAASFNFNTLVRYDDDTAISNYTDVDFNDNDYCLYFGNIGTLEEPNYAHEIEEEIIDVIQSTLCNYTYDIASNIEFVTLTYLENGVSYTVLVDSTNIDYDTELPTTPPGETVEPDEAFDWLAFIESVIEWLANNWQWVVAAIVLLIALSLIKYVKGAIDSLVWIFKTILNIILLPFKIIAYILDLIFKRK